MSFNIIGTGQALPKQTLTNEDLSAYLDTSDEWIYTRTGIKSRQVMTDETLTELSIKAAKAAIDNSGVSPKEISYVIASTIAGDYITPSLSCLIQSAVGAHCPAFDINAACTGFIYTLDIADSLFKSGKAEYILIVCSEAMTSHIDKNDRSVAVLFGDGAGAVLLKKGDGLRYVKTYSSGTAEPLNIPRNGTLYMNGQDVFKFAVNRMVTGINDALAACELTVSDISLIIPHQANARIIEAAKSKLKTENVVQTIKHLGNISSATIPITLDMLASQGKLNKGDKLVLSAFGGGLTSGTAILEW